MTDLALLPNDGGPSAARPDAPLPLPVECHLVRAVRACEAAKSRAEQALLYLEYAPRNAEQMLAVLRGLHDEAETALVNFIAFDHVRTCQGQA